MSEYEKNKALLQLPFPETSIKSSETLKKAEKQLKEIFQIRADLSSQAYCPKVVIETSSSKNEVSDLLDTVVPWIQKGNGKHFCIQFQEDAEKHLLLLKDSIQTHFPEVKVWLQVDNLVDDGLTKLTELIDQNIDVIKLKLAVKEETKLTENMVYKLNDAVKSARVVAKVRIISFQKKCEELLWFSDLVRATPARLSDLHWKPLSLEKFESTLPIVHHVRKVDLKVFPNESYRNFIVVLPKEARIQVHTKKKDLEDLFRALAHPKELCIVDIMFVRDMRAGKEGEEFVKLIKKLAKNFGNLYKVTINAKDIRDVNEEGRVFHEKQLASGLGRRLTFLIENKAKGKYSRGKVMVLGQGGAGKSSTLRSLSGQKFVKHHVKTIVAEKLNIMDTDGDTFKLIEQQNEAFISDLAYAAAQVFEAPMSFDGKEKRVIQGDKMEEVINKGAKLQEEKLKKQNKVLVKSLNELKFVEKKKGDRNIKQRQQDKKSLNRNEDDVDEFKFTELENRVKHSWWDFGGQRVFDAVHSLYLTENGILIFVFSLKRLMKYRKKTLERVRRWLISIQLYSKHCKVLMVGTRAEDKSVRKKIKQADDAIKSLQAEYYKIDYVYNSENELSFFPMENSNKKSPYLTILKNKILELSRDKTLNSTWNRYVELSWMFFMHNIYSTEKNIVSFLELEKEASSAGFSSTEIHEMINFFASAGELLDFRYLIEDKEKNSIVMKPKWLLEVLGTLISSRDGTHLKKVLDKIAAECREGSKALLRLLREQGVLSSLLLKKLLIQVHNVSEEEFELVVEVCEKMMIMARFDELPKELGISDLDLRKNQTFWVVPSFFVQEDEESEAQNEKRGLLPIHKNLNLSLDFIEEEISWSQLAPMSLFAKFVCCVINSGRYFHGNKFRVEKLTGKALTCTLNKKVFQIILEKYSLYFLRIYSKESEFEAQIVEIIGRAYGDIQVLRRIGRVVADEECAFFQNIAVDTLDNDVSYAVKVNEEDLKWDAFLSHTWRNGVHTKVVEIGKFLKNKGVFIWLDENEMTDDINLGMLNGINQSSAFIAFITQEYLESSNDKNSNAGKEFKLASSIGVQYIIPVVLDPALLDPTTWNKYVVGLNLSGVLYVDFSTPEKIAANLDTLIERIEQVKNMRNKEFIMNGK